MTEGFTKASLNSIGIYVGRCMTLVENGALVLVGNDLSSRFINRDNEIETKGPHPLVLVGHNLGLNSLHVAVSARWRLEDLLVPVVDTNLD